MNDQYASTTLQTYMLNIERSIQTWGFLSDEVFIDESRERTGGGDDFSSIRFLISQLTLIIIYWYEHESEFKNG